MADENDTDPKTENVGSPFKTSDTGDSSEGADAGDNGAEGLDFSEEFSDMVDQIETSEDALQDQIDMVEDIEEQLNDIAEQQLEHAEEQDALEPESDLMQSLNQQFDELLGDDFGAPSDTDPADDEPNEKAAAVAWTNRYNPAKNKVKLSDGNWYGIVAGNDTAVKLQDGRTIPATMIVDAQIGGAIRNAPGQDYNVASWAKGKPIKQREYDQDEEEAEEEMAEAMDSYRKKKTEANIGIGTEAAYDQLADTYLPQTTASSASPLDDYARVLEASLDEGDDCPTCDRGVLAHTKKANSEACICGHTDRDHGNRRPGGGCDECPCDFFESAHAYKAVACLVCTACHSKFAFEDSGDAFDTNALQSKMDDLACQVEQHKQDEETLRREVGDAAEEVASIIDMFYGEATTEEPQVEQPKFVPETELEATARKKKADVPPTAPAQQPPPAQAPVDDATPMEQPAPSSDGLTLWFEQHPEAQTVKIQTNQGFFEVQRPENNVTTVTPSTIQRGAPRKVNVPAFVADIGNWSVITAWKHTKAGRVRVAFTQPACAAKMRVPKVKVGDEVLTPNGRGKVKEVLKERDYVKVELEHGDCRSYPRNRLVEAMKLAFDFGQKDDEDEDTGEDVPAFESDEAKEEFGGEGPLDDSDEFEEDDSFGDDLDFEDDSYSPGESTETMPEQEMVMIEVDPVADEFGFDDGPAPDLMELRQKLSPEAAPVDQSLANPIEDVKERVQQHVDKGRQLSEQVEDIRNQADELSKLLDAPPAYNESKELMYPEDSYYARGPEISTFG